MGKRFAEFRFRTNLLDIDHLSIVVVTVIIVLMDSPVDEEKIAEFP